MNAAQRQFISIIRKIKKKKKLKEICQKPVMVKTGLKLFIVELTSAVYIPQKWFYFYKVNRFNFRTAVAEFSVNVVEVYISTLNKLQKVKMRLIAKVINLKCYQYRRIFKFDYGWAIISGVFNESEWTFPFFENIAQPGVRTFFTCSTI